MRLDTNKQLVVFHLIAKAAIINGAKTHEKRILTGEPEGTNAKMFPRPSANWTRTLKELFTTIKRNSRRRRSLDMQILFFFVFKRRFSTLLEPSPSVKKTRALTCIMRKVYRNYLIFKSCKKGIKI